MTGGEGKAEVIDLEGLLARNEYFVRAAVEAEMTEAIGAEKGERTGTRLELAPGFGTRASSEQQFLPCHRAMNSLRQ